MFRTFTAIDARYMRLGLAWGKIVRTVSGIDPTFVCADERSYAFLGRNGFPVLARIPAEAMSSDKRSRHPRSTFPSDSAAYTASLKMASAIEFLEAGESILYSDVDAIWLRDPIDELTKFDADLVFQPGIFPADARKRWGFAICTGFFYLRSSALALTIARKVRDRFD